jgi:hypothetical protein
MKQKRTLIALAICLFTLGHATRSAELPHVEKTKLIRVPNGGIQPQVVLDSRGTIHLIYYTGDSKAGDIFYVTSKDGGVTFSTPLRVNSVPESAIAAGTIRGAHIALGQAGQVHVAWNGSSKAKPKGPLNPEQPADSPHNGTPMLYSRLNASGTAFEPQRNLMQRTFGLDGGGSVAADRDGNVYVAWHGKAHGAVKGEEGRGVWLAVSRDGGKMFAPEAPISDPSTGACACCSVRVFVDRENTVSILYRSAKEVVNRDIYLLTSNDQGKTFRSAMLHPWNIGACPMSSMHFAEASAGLLAAWETREQVFFSHLNPGTSKNSEPVSPPGTARKRKHPWLATNSANDTIFAWTENTGWAKGGDLAWQIFDKTGKPKGKQGRVEAIAAWNFGVAYARPDGGFAIIY